MLSFSISPIVHLKSSPTGLRLNVTANCHLFFLARSPKEKNVTVCSKTLSTALIACGSDLCNLCSFDLRLYFRLYIFTITEHKYIAKYNIWLVNTHGWVFNVAVLENPGTFCWTNYTFWLILLSVLTSKTIQPGTQLRVPPSDPSRTELLFAKNPPSLLWFAWTCNKYSWISIFSRSSRCLK